MTASVAIERVVIPGVRGSFYQWRLSNGRAVRASRRDWLALGGDDGQTVISLDADDAQPAEPTEAEFAGMMGW